MRVRTALTWRVEPPPEPPLAGAPLVRVRTGVETGVRREPPEPEPEPLLFVPLVRVRTGVVAAAGVYPLVAGELEACEPLDAVRGAAPAAATPPEPGVEPVPPATPADF